MLKKIIHAFQWCAAHWAITLACFLVVAIGTTTAICWQLFKPKPKLVPIYVTIEGLGEGKDMVDRELFVEDGENIADIFSRDYPEIYKMFQQPYVYNNQLISIQGVRETATKKFYVTIDGTLEPVLPNAYIWEGATVTISYR